jgi:hypothetical protein
VEVTLKEAATLCKKSEKTLRRKIEAGLLGGRKESLEFGGFMWMIDVESLDELYPGSRPNHLPQVYSAPEPPQIRLKSRPEQETGPDHAIVAQPDAKHYGDCDELTESDEDGEEWSARQSFFDYILDENRNLKNDLRDRDSRILSLNERAFVLERALGDQEGTSLTQARVLEWFQSQEAVREKSRQETERKLLAAPQQKREKPVANLWTAALAGAGAVLIFVMVLISTGLIAFAS